jgi:hypothetical protein
LNPVAKKKVRSLAALFVVLGGAAAHAQVQSEPFADIAAGPVFDKFGLTLDAGTGMEAAGPFYYHRESPDQSLWGIPPFYTQIRQPDVEAFTFDALPPFLVYHRHGSETTLLITPLLNVFGGQYQGGVRYRRGMLFPLYYRQVCSDPTRNYLAVFPFYGTIKGRFQRSEIHFVLFPLYSRTHKRDVVTDNYLFPFVHTRTGNGLTGWQFWPLAGAEHKTLTSRTNLLGVAEPVGGHDKRFLLWPIYFDEKTGLGTDHPQEYHAVWPFYTSTTSPQRSSTGVVFPLFTYTNDREKKYREWDFPWPLFVIARGEGKHITRFFPFYNRGRGSDIKSDSSLWPLYMRQSFQAGALQRSHTRVMIYLFNQVKEKNTQTGETRHRTDFWPFLTHKRDWEGRERLQVFSILEPILPANDTVDRSFAPLYSVWRSERNPKTQARSQSLLWNLYRHDSTPQLERTALLFGLFQHRKTPKEDVLRVFFIPFKSQSHGTQPAAAPATTINRGNAAATFGLAPRPPASLHHV